MESKDLNMELTDSIKELIHSVIFQVKLLEGIQIEDSLNDDFYAEIFNHIPTNVFNLVNNWGWNDVEVRESIYQLTREKVLNGELDSFL